MTFVCSWHIGARARVQSNDSLRVDTGVYLRNIHGQVGQFNCIATVHCACCYLRFSLLNIVAAYDAPFLAIPAVHHRYEKALIIGVTAVLGGALVVKGFDSLARPGGVEHLDVTTLTGDEVTKDVSPRARAHMGGSSWKLVCSVSTHVLRSRHRRLMVTYMQRASAFAMHGFDFAAIHCTF